MLQPRCMNSEASQSSSSGWVGRSPWVPKSSLVKTMPRPKTSCQMRFTATREVSGCLWRDQPAGEAEARFAGRHRRQHGERAGLDFGAALAPIALHMNVRLGRRVVFKQHRRVADGRQFGGERIELGAQFGELQASQCSFP